MKPIFDLVNVKTPQKNSFDLSHGRKLSTNFGKLTPILCEPVMPGESWRCKTELMIRMSPTVAPVMHKIEAFVHYFFVPNRLLWDNWQDFITGGEDGTEEPVHPYISLSARGINCIGNTLADHLGFHTADGTNVGAGTINALPFRAYHTIFNEYYRDQNIDDEATVVKTDGADSSTELAMRYVRYEKDYFTSALPWPQRGESVGVSIIDSEVILKAYGTDEGETTNQPVLLNAVARTNFASKDVQTSAAGKLEDGSSNLAVLDPNDTLDVSGGTIDINDLRTAHVLQRWLETNARIGSRYIEQILAHFGVRSSDARLQRPEYLGGGRTNIKISEIVQTSETNTTPQGTMAGHGIGIGVSNQFKYHFEEHGFVFGLLSIRPRSAYSQGLRRFFRYADKFDYPWPEFAQLGEQEVFVNEIWVNPTNMVGDVDEAFGYQSRYADCKWIPDSVHGDMLDTFDYWHMARKFDTEPALDDDFLIVGNGEDATTRIFPDPEGTQDRFWIQTWNDIKAIKPLPFFNDPTL